VNAALLFFVAVSIQFNKGKGFRMLNVFEQEEKGVAFPVGPPNVTVLTVTGVRRAEKNMDSG
jgi:hypothetical protein